MTVGAEGVTVNSVTVVDETSITVDVDVAVAAVLGPTTLSVRRLPPGPGFGAVGLCGACLTVTT